jgi:hypothetical protein
MKEWEITGSNMKYLITFTNGKTRTMDAPNVKVAAEIAYRFYALLYGYGEFLSATKLPIKG